MSRNIFDCYKWRLLLVCSGKKTRILPNTLKFTGQMIHMSKSKRQTQKLSIMIRLRNSGLAV